MAKHKYLIDSTILIDAFRGQKKAIAFLSNIDPIVISIVTQAELIEGARSRTELEKINRIIHTYPVLPITDASSKRAITLLKTYFLKHGILFDDALIAATALEHNLTLATTEKKHFSPIKGLILYSPY